MICKEVVRDTAEKLKQGVSLKDVRAAIDARFADRAHLATPTPKP